MRPRCIVLIVCYLFFVSIATAQKGFSGSAGIGCGTSDIMKQLYQKDNKYLQLDQQIEQQLLQLKKTTPTSDYTQAIVTLPVVVHIIHNNGSENISDARVLAGIQHLNEAYANSGYYNPADGINTNIQFCMAQRDANGNATNGITRDISSYTNMGGPDYYSDDQNVKNINRWNPNCYINIWIVNNIPGNVAGYAYMPAAHGSNTDGIIVEADFFGSSYANDVVIIHEMGHYLGLYHTFEGGCTNADCLTDGDKVCDTPPDNSTSFTSCNIPVNSCNTDIQSGFSSDQNDLTQDYMDYGNWDCMTVFTQGQGDRMNWFIINVRSSLLKCRSCLPPCPNPVTANFNSSATNINVGASVNFTNTSVNGTSYQWYINDVLQSATVNFSNTFNSAGVYLIKLAANGNNNTLCDSSAKQEVINVTCPVTAGFTASAVEIPAGQTINFTNTSVGASTSYNWYIDNVLVSNNMNFSNQFMLPGTFTIKLVVDISTCSSEKSITIDVTTPCDNNRYFEKMISLPTSNFGPKQTLIARDSSIIILGATVTPFPNPYTEAFTIMKLSKNGNLLWSKNYYTTVRLTPLRIMQTYDGNFIAVGLQAFGSLTYKTFIMKIDGNGNLIWQKSYTKTGISNFYSGVDGTLQETTSHDLLLGITMERTNNEGYKTYLLKLSSNGNIIWNKEVNSVSSITNAALKNNSLYTSYVSLVTTPYFQVTADIAKIDITNGTLVFAKKYSFPPPSVPNVTQILRFENLVLFNDELRLTGTITAGSGIGDTGSHIITRIDTFGIIQDIKRVRFTDPQLYITNNLPTYYRHGIVTNNGEYAFFEMGQNPLVPYTSKVFIHHTDISANNLTTKEIFKNVYPNFHYKPVDFSRNDNFKDRGNNNMVMACFVKESLQQNAPMGMIVRSSDYSGVVSGNCPIPSGTHTNFPSIITGNNAPNITITDAPFTEDVSFNLQDSVIQFNSTNICSANTINCYSVKIDFPDTVCVTQDSVLISSHRNPGCTQPVTWSVSVPDQNAYRIVNDTTIKVKFSTYGNYDVIATLASCSNITDTVHLYIAKNASQLSLGPDKTLCTFSTAVLNAGSGFKTYNWYNGTTDSTTTIYNAGKYFITVTDYCNNTTSDTINITLVNSPVFDLTPAQIIICNNDTLSLTAPSGFNNYTWASNYNINSTIGQSIKVWPAKDTIYSVTAIYNNSCTVLDSIKILVKPAIKINLGNDTSFCTGKSVYLDAGSGFNNYNWSTGAITPGITVSTVGMYSVEATNNSGCISRDTIQVITVYPKPVVNLGTDTSICKNTPLVLNAGNISSTYLWQDNSSAQFFPAKNVGTYWVIVTNSNGCIGTDSLNILKVFDTAANFVLPVYEICSNSKQFIKAIGIYNSYLWSVGVVKDSVLINQPGNYWLQVMNISGCKAKEEFIVKTKKCMEGVYFPNTFTPNNDIYNNIFKALVFEDLAHFELVIYNRYGQKIFATNDYASGWDGTFNGVKQPGGTYVWICSYKLKTGSSQIEKGTILLLR